MKALTYHSAKDVRVENLSAPVIQDEQNGWRAYFWPFMPLLWDAPGPVSDVLPSSGASVPELSSPVRSPDCMPSSWLGRPYVLSNGRRCRVPISCAGWTVPALLVSVLISSPFLARVDARWMQLGNPRATVKYGGFLELSE